jgi:hypothetical protein
MVAAWWRGKAQRFDESGQQPTVSLPQNTARSAELVLEFATRGGVLPPNLNHMAVLALPVIHEANRAGLQAWTQAEAIAARRAAAVPTNLLRLCITLVFWCFNQELLAPELTIPTRLFATLFFLLLGSMATIAYLTVVLLGGL